MPSSAEQQRGMADFSYGENVNYKGELFKFVFGFKHRQLKIVLTPKERLN